MIRILHLPNTLSKNSGIMSVIMNYYRNIDKDQIQFDFLCFKSDGTTYAEEIKCLGGKIFYIANKNMKQEIRNFLYKYSSEYSIVHYHAISKWGLYLGLFREGGIKHVIIHAHNAQYADTVWKSKRNRWLTKYSLRSCTDYIACSRKAANLLYGDHDNVYILNNAVALDQFLFENDIRREVRETLHLCSDDIVLGHVGRFEHQKNHKFLLRVFTELHRKNAKYKLLLIGEGSLMDEIKNLAQEYGIVDQVFFLGHRSDVYRYFNAMDVFILPSLYEGLPVVGIEAQASGLPCVFSNEVTDEINICNCKFIGLQSAIHEWIDCIEHIDRKRADNRCKLRCQGFDIKQESFKLRELYKGMAT